MFTLAAIVLALAQFRGGGAVQPHTYVSPSGEWSLFIDPSSRDGDGKSTLTISHQGKVEWRGEQSFTFRDAVINDEGVSAGLVYDSRSMFGGGEVRLLGKDGASLLVRAIACAKEHSFGSPGRLDLSITLQPVRNIVIVCARDSGEKGGDERWFVYQLSPVEKLGIEYAARALKVPEDHPGSLALAAIHGTPLTLAEWSLRTKGDGSAQMWGSEFALYDEAWKLVWSLPLPTDFGSYSSSYDHRDGEILDTHRDRRFELHQLATDEVVTYEVTRAPTAKTGWTVREISREPFKAEVDKLPKLELSAGKSVLLDVEIQKPSGPLCYIGPFTFDDADQITYVRGETDGADTLVALDAEGKVKREVPVALIDPVAKVKRRWTALAGGDWLVTLSPDTDPTRPKSSAWRVHGNTGLATELKPIVVDDHFAGVSLDAIAPMADGGFVVLGNHHVDSTSKKVMERYKADGSTLWKIEEQFEFGRASSIHFAVDVAENEDGTLVVLNQGERSLAFFDAGGKLVKQVELDKSLHTEMSQLTDLLLAPDGSFLIHDRDQSTWHRITRDGKQVAAFSVRRENGSTRVGESSDARLDHAGRLWSTDGYQFFQIDEKGIAHARFGNAPDPAQLAVVGFPFIAGAGRLAIED